jgi:hypothetical protein
MIAAINGVGGVKFGGACANETWTREMAPTRAVANDEYLTRISPPVQKAKFFSEMAQ